MLDYFESENGVEAFKKALRKNKLNFFYRKDKNIKVFKDIEREGEFSTKIYLGIREIPLEKIVGTVEKGGDFDRNFNPKRDSSKNRWVNVYNELVIKGTAPPVVLYKVRDEYYVYDGNHRVSVAKNLAFISLEAEVYEFFSSKNDILDKLSRERFAFELETKLKKIDVSLPESYLLLRDEIKSFSDLFYDEEESYLEKCDNWYRRIFTPIVNIITRNILEFEESKNGDIFLDYLKYKKESIYRDRYTRSLVNYLNVKKRDEISNLKIDIVVDNIIIGDFRKIYDFDRLSLFNNETRDKILAIREFSKKRFRRESLILGEISLYGKINKIHGFTVAMQLWFENVYEVYQKEWNIKINSMGLVKKFENSDKIIEDAMRFSRYYRERSGRLLSYLEILYNYMLEIYIPSVLILDENSIDKEDIEDEYLKITQSYLYYRRYGGEDTLKEFVEGYLLESYGSKITDFIFSKNKKFDADVTKDLLEFTTLEKYGGTESYKTIKKLKEYIKSLDIENKELIDLKLDNDFKAFANQEDIILDYNNKRVFNLIRGIWGSYTFVDYCSDLLKR